MHEYVVKKCLLCQSEDHLQELYPKNFRDEDLTPAIFSARRVTEHWHYTIVRCAECGLVFSKETLSDADLFHLYSASTVTFSEHTGTIRRDYWRPLQKYVTRLTREAAVEIGCSSGFFLDELLEQGMGEVVGFEPSTQAREVASERVKDQIRSCFFEGGKSVEGKRFGLVCSFQTLDHLSDPLAFLNTCQEVLKPGGLVYLVTHDVEALQAKILGEKSPIIDVEHIYLFNKQTLPRLLEKTGFRVLETRSFCNSYPLSYWATMFPMPQPLRRATLAALNATGLASFAPSIRAGNLYAIAERV